MQSRTREEPWTAFPERREEMMKSTRPWEALHRPLCFAAKDGFHHLDSIAHLGETLHRAALGLAAVLSGEAAARLLDYADRLGAFEEKVRGERARLVAEGLRLCASLAPPGIEGGVGTRPSHRGGPGAAERVADHAPSLASPPTVLRGVGPKIAARLAARGLHAVEDLLYLFPLEYLDHRTVLPLETLGQEREGEGATTRGVVVTVRTKAAFRRRGRGVELGLSTIPEGKPLLWCVWFRAHGGLASRFGPGTRVLVSGIVRAYRGELQMVHPDILEDPEGESSGSIRRRYPEVEGVAPGRVAQICAEACREFSAEFADAVPRDLAAELGLVGQAEALRALHLPDPALEPDELGRLQRGEHAAQRRLVFDELFSLQLAIAVRRTSWERHRAFPCRLTGEGAQRLRTCLPFALTGAQERAVSEILECMDRPTPMHRLLQGDVGSGKTVVAFAAATAAMQSGLQAAVMAPTEILARQHYEVMDPWCRALGHRAALLTGETPRAVRQSLLVLADAGEIQLLVGTHALLARDISLPNLGLAVVDEQHRFGVIQRVRFRDRSEESPLPHLLVMTATPIPRTLALCVYGDLDLSLLHEKPPGRRPVETLRFGGAGRAGAYEMVAQRLDLGQQVFVVCPLVDESEKLAVASAAATAERLAEQFPERRVGLVHGRLAPREREQTMDRFRRKEIDILVATTVIEVGIDVPSANVMVVEHAERFGLAQLHQLRGRVGRGETESLCLLLSDAAADTAAGQRLATLTRSNDGFEIAEADLALRGPGEIFGTRQSGVPRLRFADLRQHLQILAEARDAAAAVVARDPTLSLPQHEQARKIMTRRWERLPLLGAEAG